MAGEEGIGVRDPGDDPGSKLSLRCLRWQVAILKKAC